MINNWVQSGNQFRIQEVSQLNKLLPVGVYKLVEDQYGALFLEQIQENFSFPYKIYGIEKDFIARVVRTYNNTKSNLGVLLNGVKGTGKTVTSQLIANELNIPVIIVSRDFNGLVNFINDIQQDVIIFFDEFEKIFPRDYSSGSKLLTVMDGALKNSYRKVYLLTTNHLTVEENLMQRPGRVRYLKTFGNLDTNAVIEIIDDKLERPQFKQELIAFIAELDLITVDIVSSVIQEVNIHNEPPQAFSSVFNVRKSERLYNVFKMSYDEEGKPVEKQFAKGARIIPTKVTDDEISDTFYVNRRDIGEIIEVINSDVFIVEEDEQDEEGNYKTVKNTYRIERESYINASYAKYLDV